MRPKLALRLIWALGGSGAWPAPPPGEVDEALAVRSYYTRYPVQTNTILIFFVNQTDKYKLQPPATSCHSPTITHHPSFTQELDERLSTEAAEVEDGCGERPQGERPVAMMLATFSVRPKQAGVLKTSFGGSPTVPHSSDQPYPCEPHDNSAITPPSLHHNSTILTNHHQAPPSTTNPTGPPLRS